MTKETTTEVLPNFQNTEIAFQSKSDKQLLKTAMLFQRSDRRMGWDRTKSDAY